MTLTQDMLMKMSVADKNKLGRAMMTGMKKPPERPCTGCSLFARDDECAIRWKTFYDKNGGAGHECWYPEGAIPAEAESEALNVVGM